METRNINDNVEEVFFDCPDCHERYISHYTNDKIKNLQHEMKKSASSKYKRRIITKQIEEEMDRLKELIGTQ